MAVLTGLEVFLREEASRHKGKALGLLANQASVGPDFRHALDLLDEATDGAVKTIFGPQHGYRGEKQDNMVESPHSKLKDGRPVYSLYAEKRAPEPRMFEGLDAVLVDLQDVGTRVYTFAHTLSLFMERAARAGLPVIVLDRPNPVGGKETEGNLLDPSFSSFVGLHPIPMRHGFTMGELALFANSRLEKPCSLTVVPCRDLERDWHFGETGLPWVAPSPNMPSPETALAYPGTVIFEGTGLSEGRGTTEPFLVVGAPYVDPDEFARALRDMKLPGVAFRECFFLPNFQKWAGSVCGGAEIRVTDKKSFKPWLTGLSILETILRTRPDDFELKAPPYEYELERRPIDLILGNGEIFDKLRAGTSAKEIAEGFEKDLEIFSKTRKDFLLYR
ncbi:MAG: DUF1343 domain-containing protein [Deltaproteobacteria bacterium]|jgi:uncharacterized protein YbbC (DUF1343 family)|nr:DUF1343 domain-containing protein [Deltaproteobacteria bacterium]